MNTLVIVLIAAVVLFGAYMVYGRWLAKKWGIDPKAETPAVKYSTTVKILFQLMAGQFSVISSHQLQEQVL